MFRKKSPTIHRLVYKGHVTPVFGGYLSSEEIHLPSSQKFWFQLSVFQGLHVIQQQKTPQKQCHKEEALSPKTILSFHVLRLVCRHCLEKLELYFWVLLAVGRGVVGDECSDEQMGCSPPLLG